MSKSNASIWQELPNWRVEEEYAFLSNASLPEWAWEFLRRNPGYRADYKSCYGENKNLAEENEYDPPKNPNESKEQYIARMLHQGLEYSIKEFPQLCAEKWGIQNMHSPYKPLPYGGIFSQLPKLPRVLTDLEQAEQYFENTDHFNDENTFIGTTSSSKMDVAVVVFDMKISIAEQLEQIRHRLLAMQQCLEIIPAKKERTSGQKGKWLRHIRVLDAKRSNPAPTNKEVSIVLGPTKSSKDNGSHEDRGEEFYEKARNAMRSYKKILHHSSGKVLK